MTTVGLHVRIKAASVGKTMTQAKEKFTTFEEYLSYSDKTPIEGRYELVDGELIELPPESELNIWIADNLQFLSSDRQSCLATAD